MTKTHKKVFGLLGVVAVAAVTAFAAFLPNPLAQATTTVTDEITVRVVGSTPEINITSPENGSVFTARTQTISYNYANAKTITLSLDYTNMNGETTTYQLGIIDADYNAAEGSATINLADYGYGDFVFYITGTAISGDSYNEAVSFSYLPLTASVEQNNQTGNYDVSLDYNAANEDIKKIEVTIYDENGNLVDGPQPIVVTPPIGKAFIDPDDFNLGTGKYYIHVTAYGENGNPLYKPYILVINHQGDEEDVVPVPDTGGLFQNTNISTTDYLVTGLVVFGLVAIAGIMFIMRGDKKKAPAKVSMKNRVKTNNKTRRK